MTYKISNTTVLDSASLVNIDSIDAGSITSINTAISSNTALIATMYDTSSSVPGSADSSTFHYIKNTKELRFYDGTSYKFIGFGVADGL